MEKIRGSILVRNGRPESAEGYQPPASSGFFYEVVRLDRGRFMFLQDHLERLIRSCEQRNSNCPDPLEIQVSLDMLLKHEPFHEGNIKILFYRDNEQPQVVCYFIPHRYPTPEEYRLGVHLKTFRYTRPEPNVKRWNDTFRREVGQFIEAHGIYEAALVNEDGYLTEGSRSNLFFIDPRGTVVTAPAHAVLPGITRKHVLAFCHENRLPVRETLITPEGATHMQSCFISGTSPKVLPVKSLDAISYDVTLDLLRKIMESCP